MDEGFSPRAPGRTCATQKSGGVHLKGAPNATPRPPNIKNNHNYHFFYELNPIAIEKK
jgi:hypothetical protein